MKDEIMPEEKKKQSTKRRDSHNRVLKSGEYERKDGIYEYRFVDTEKKTRSIYAGSLKELREKEREAADQHGSDPVQYDGNMTVADLVERYISTRRGFSANTRIGYNYVKNFVCRHPFGKKIIRNIHISDGKQFLIGLFDEGYAYHTIASIRSILKCAFQMAYADEIINKNPLDFRLDIIPNNTRKRVALTEKQQKQFMDYIAAHEYYSRYWDEINVLLGTGMRVSELCGLTRSDLNFKKRRIRVNHQLLRTSAGEWHVEKTKTESGRRFIPMSDTVYISLRNILANRQSPEQEIMIDGYAGFLLLDRYGMPRLSSSIEHVLERIWKRYNEDNIIPLPKVTPHVLRHTFCTNMANAGMDLKSLQYLMGHSDATVTLNTYTHNSYEKAEESMCEILGFSEVEPPRRNKDTPRKGCK